MEENKKELQSLLTRLGEIVPTLLFIGKTTYQHGAFMISSPEEDDDKRIIDLCSAIVIMMDQKQALREVIFSAVSWFMQENPKYRDAMQKALDKLKELDEHQRTSQSK